MFQKRDMNEIIKNINNIPDLSKGLICRTCLLPLTESVNQMIFFDNMDKELMNITSVNIFEGDGLPVYICTSCIQHLHIASKFKTQVESSDNTLKQFLEYRNSINLSNSSDLTIKDEDTIIEKQDSIKEEFQKSSDNEIVEDRDYEGNEADNYNDEYNISREETNFNEEKKIKDCRRKSSNEVENNEYLENCIKCGEEIIFIEKHVHKCKKKTSKKYVKKKPDQICEVCTETFPSKISLKEHLKNHGIVHKNYACLECGKKYNSQYDYTVHLRKHTGIRPFICEICDKSFTDPRSFKKHEKIHTGDKQYQCDICGKSFIHSYTLKSHKLIHSGQKPFVCAICGHACGTATQLKLHNRRHTQEKPYLCSLCPKTFAHKSGLSDHQMRHSGERKFICAICGKGSRTSQDLSTHLKTHNKDRPYKCKYVGCIKTYKTNSQLSAHMRTHTEI